MFTSVKTLKETCLSLLQSTILVSVKAHKSLKELNKEVFSLYQCASNNDEEGPNSKGDNCIRSRIKLLLQVRSIFMSMMDFNEMFEFCMM